MSKRKNRKQRAPNLPEDVLARARQQAVGDAADDDSEADDVEEVAPVVKEKAAPPAPVVERAASEKPASRRHTEGRPQRRERRRDPNRPMTQDDVAELLEHPTKVVAIEELREQYGYVLSDLRSMGLLAAVLMVVLVVLAQIL